MPVEDGVRDQTCLEDFRSGLCTSKHDFVFLTDHPDAFREYEYPEVLLHDPSRDRLVARGDPVANRMGCPGGAEPVIVPGLESDLMPVGLERHASDRSIAYSEVSTRAVDLLRDENAVVLVAHTENWTAEQLATFPIDGFEMYNLHANALRSAGTILELLVRADRKDPTLPQPDLSFIPIFTEDPAYLVTWGQVLDKGVRRVATMGTDCHRNTFPTILSDGERVDSYRRMMMWFSNHLLVTERPFDDRVLKEALAAGRLYGVFEVYGYADGFDFFADAGGSTFEMGSEVPVGAILRVRTPRVRGVEVQPTLRMILSRATASGWEVAAESDTDLELGTTVAGAYRVEVRVRPTHLAEHLGSFRPTVVREDRVWIYSNPIYVR